MADPLLVQSIRRDAKPLTQAGDYDAIVDAVGDARIVLLGEASHGTSEFYTMRAEITKRLLERKGFRIIAVEGDWPSCYEINRWIKNYTGAAATARGALAGFGRWPEWMWANEEIETFAQWLKAFNGIREGNDRAGIYGFDVYSLWESMEETIRYLRNTNSPELDQAIRAYECFGPYGRDEQAYGAAAAYALGESCEQEVVDLLRDLRMRRMGTNLKDEESLNAVMNTLVAADAERYYRAMIHGGPDSWNIRDTHMTEVMAQLMNAYGDDAKIIVWAHNTHIGDARATDMADEGMVNVGQLARERFGAENVFAIGFGTYEGTVVAGRSWGAQAAAMRVPKAMEGSWEDAMHEAGVASGWLLFRGRESDYGERIGHRAIGVVYQPQYERFGNYVPSTMSARYDAFVFVDRTNALKPVVLEPVLS
ncbi:erythromycin esterase family protein [Paenibacillus methanolicus]|uniref:Erythromycin esterase-like protein n=1 Tax=Paenibacillus methanolicus TaxID=582686 RepID=A0A5S5CLI5_9BACL|nr:erythromycin esterase family protein [Paenibacillus methanolicus]TYP79565.1 erythromycin esterase-like protein [Paenibacillus methanolicus]